MQKCCLCGRKVHPVKKLGKILLFALIFGVFCMASAFCAEDVQTFSVNIVVNGDEYAEAEIGASVDGNVYTFQVNELLEALGLNLTYDEETDVATISAEPDTLAAVLFSELEPSDEPSDEPSEEPEIAMPPTLLVPSNCPKLAQLTMSQYVAYPTIPPTQAAPARVFPLSKMRLAMTACDRKVPLATPTKPKPSTPWK